MRTLYHNSLAQNNPNNNYHQRLREEGDTKLDKTLARLETFLSFLGFNQSMVLSWTVFVLIGIVIPVAVIELCDCSDCESYQIRGFELKTVASLASLEAVSLFCISHNLRKYGTRKFLFVDRYNGQMSWFHDEYIKQIKIHIF